MGQRITKDVRDTEAQNLLGENKAHTEQANDNTSNVILHDKISYRGNDFIKPINYKLVNILN